jgi:hypothetical protein
MLLGREKMAATITPLPPNSGEKAMATSPIMVGTELARALVGLPTIRQLDEMLRTGKLSVDDRSRAIIDKGLLRYAQWDTIRQRRDRRKALR